MRLQAIAHSVDALLFEDDGHRVWAKGVPQVPGRRLARVVPHYDDALQVRHSLIMVEELEENISAVIGLHNYSKTILRVQ